MAPNNKQKKKAANHEPSVEDLKRLGMSDEDIDRIMAERSKSAEEKKAEQEKEAAARREIEHRHRVIKEISKKCDVVAAEEQCGRVLLLKKEDEAWTPFFADLTKEKILFLRSYQEQEARKRVQLAKKKHEEELKALHEQLEKMSHEERAAIAAATEEDEKQKTLASLQRKEAKRLKDERRAARRAARRAKRLEEDEFDFESDDDSADRESSEELTHLRL